MSRNPREPSQPAEDNPAGHTRGQIHRFQPEFHSNPNLTTDPGRPPIPSTTTVTPGQLNTVVSTSDNVNASESIASVADPFVSRGMVYHSPPPTTSVPNPGPTAGTDITSDLEYGAAGSSVFNKKATHSTRMGSRATSPDRHDEESREREQHQRRIEEADGMIREAAEQAERMRIQNQRNYETFQRMFERDRQERAGELQELEFALGRRREEFRQLDTEVGMARASSDAARAEAERARAVAEHARDETERELLRIKSELQRAGSEASLQRGFAPGQTTSVAGLGQSQGANLWSQPLRPRSPPTSQQAVATYGGVDLN